MQRIALVTTDLTTLGVEDADLPLVAAALGDADLDVGVNRWDDPQVDWSAFEAVIMRSPWDYSGRLPEFLAWLARVESTSRVLNPPELIRWNLDKAYLLDLGQHGVPIVPTTICDTVPDVEAAVASLGTGRVVIKPNVSVGSRDTGLFRPGSPDITALAERILLAGKRVLVEPAVPSIATEGEHALLYFGGTFSHAVRKGPLLADGGGLLGGSYQQHITADAVDAAEVAVADSAMAAVRAHGADDGPPLYARLDVVRLDDGFALLEAELFEPSYFLATSPGSERHFAAAVLTALAGTA